MFVVTFLSLFSSFILSGSARQCYTCRPELNEDCCTSIPSDLSQCESLIPTEEFIARDTLRIPCDTGTNCISGSVIWTSPHGTRCEFRDGGNRECRRDHSIVFEGDFSTGRCDIYVNNPDASIHEGVWKVDVALERRYSDELFVSFSGLKTEELLGLGSGIFFLIVIIIVIACIWIRCPILCCKTSKEPPHPDPPYRGRLAMYRTEDVYDTIEKNPPRNEARRSNLRSEDDDGIYIQSQTAIVETPEPRTAKLIPQKI